MYVILLSLLLILLFLYLCYHYKNNTYIKPSTIHGDGLFANKYFKKNDIIINNIFPYKIKNKKLYNIISSDKFNNYIIKEGKYINHCSNNYNTIIYTDDHIIYQLIAIKDINENEEILCNYNITNKNYPFIAKADNNFKSC
jgi:hypothetical protein